MAARVGGDHPVPLGEDAHVVVPHPVVDKAGVEQHDEVAGAGVAVGEIAVGGREGTEVEAPVMTTKVS